VNGVTSPSISFLFEGMRSDHEAKRDMIVVWQQPAKKTTVTKHLS
jgi:hypothetical protein